MSLQQFISLREKTTPDLIVDGDGAKAVQKEQQGGVHVMEQVSGLMAFRAQRKADFGGPADQTKGYHGCKISNSIENVNVAYIKKISI